ncbi:hypothetical protein P691DRAFT_781151 [Macrolepiota fuliginosa MF-IS2]|uniref:Uncharacterized protein n=1 Tax=Macrolepiota fuliginosa MF-IS2 TaxID=1400762 RepID=A0A9P6BVL1_9AGAR|nr:hypothetical protein P691DRAFT_781151 [Macrolepiota fuliginosa MF-IS2]
MGKVGSQAGMEDFSWMDIIDRLSLNHSRGRGRCTAFLVTYIVRRTTNAPHQMVVFNAPWRAHKALRDTVNRLVRLVLLDLLLTATLVSFEHTCQTYEGFALNERMYWGTVNRLVGCLFVQLIILIGKNHPERRVCKQPSYSIVTIDHPTDVNSVVEHVDKESSASYELWVRRGAIGNNIPKEPFSQTQ